MFVIGPHNKLIVRDYLAKCLVVFNEQLQYSHSITTETLQCPTGLAVKKRAAVCCRVQATL